MLYSQETPSIESLLGSTVNHTSALSLSSCSKTSAHLILLGGPHLLIKMRPPTQLTTSPIPPAECGFVNRSAGFRSPATLCTTIRLAPTTSWIQKNFTSTCLVLPTTFLDEIDWAVDEFHPQCYAKLDTQVIRHGLKSQTFCGGRHWSIELCLTTARRDRGLRTAPTSQATTVNHKHATQCELPRRLASCPNPSPSTRPTHRRP